MHRDAVGAVAGLSRAGRHRRRRRDRPRRTLRTAADGTGVAPSRRACATTRSTRWCWPADPHRLQIFLGQHAARHGRRAPMPPGSPAVASTRSGHRRASLRVALGCGAETRRRHGMDLTRRCSTSGSTRCWRWIYASGSRRRPAGPLPLATLLGGITGTEPSSSHLERPEKKSTFRVTDTDTRATSDWTQPAASPTGTDASQARRTRAGRRAPLRRNPRPIRGRDSPTGSCGCGSCRPADPTGALLNICLSYRHHRCCRRRTGCATRARRRRAPAHRAAHHLHRRRERRAAGRTFTPTCAPGWAAARPGRSSSEHARRLRLEVLAQREFAAPFDLSADAPLRITLVRTGADEHIMLLVAHHIAWDDGSLAGVLRRSHPCLHRCRPRPDAAGRLPRSRVDTTPDLAYWRTVMTDPPEPLELPGPTGSAVPDQLALAAHRRCACPPTPPQRVSRLARDTGATPYAVLLAVFGALLHRYTHSRRLPGGDPGAQPRRRHRRRIGYYGNTVAMRLRPQSVDDVPRAADRRPATPRSARSPISASTSTGWCASSTPTAATAPSG